MFKSSDLCILPQPHWSVPEVPIAALACGKRDSHRFAERGHLAVAQKSGTKMAPW